MRSIEYYLAALTASLCVMPAMIGSVSETVNNASRAASLTNISSNIDLPEGGFLVVTFLHKNSLWAVGREGHSHSANVSSVILNSTDQGFSWTRKAVLQNKYLNDIYFHSHLNGWAVGSEGLILRTTDGGQNWTIQKPPIGDESLNLVRFISDKKGWAIGRGGEILRTIDGGISWRSQLLPAGWQIGREFKGWLNSFSFADEYNGWVVGDQEHIYQSTDGGSSWQSKASQMRPLIKAKQFRRINYKAVRFFSKGVGYLIAELDNDSDSNSLSNLRELVILNTGNGGNDWEVRHVLKTPWLLRMQFLTETEWWMLIQSTETLLHTTDAGKTWSEVKVADDIGFGIVVFLDSNTGLSLNYDDGFSTPNLRTEDGGKTWSRYKIKYLTEDPR